MTEQTPTVTQRRSIVPVILLGVMMLGIVLMGVVVFLRLQSALNAPIPTTTPSSGVNPIDPPRAVADFTLPSTTGEPLSLSDLNGEYTMIFFGYTHCPDFCPLTLAEFRQVKAALGDDAERVNFVFISVDGARDTPEALAEYVHRFDPEFIGMSGDEATLAQMTPDFGLYYQLRTDEGRGDNYLVDHSTASYLLDPQGQLRAVFSYGAEPQVITEHLQTVMRTDGAVVGS